MFTFKLGKQRSIKPSAKPTMQLSNSDCVLAMKGMKQNSIDAIVTDPPYGLTSKTDIKSILLHWLNDIDYVHSKKGFMGKSWDGCVPGPLLWQECYRVLKPGAYMLVFGGPRTADLLTVSLRLAGFDIRDVFMFLHGMGFPKGQDLGQSVEKKLTLGAARRPDRDLGKTRNRWNGGKEGLAQTGGAIELTLDEAKKWKGWNTQIKPAYEPIILVQKPLSEKNFAENVLKWGTGGINIDASRTPLSNNDDILNKNPNTKGGFGHANAEVYGKSKGVSDNYSPSKGRYPANIIHDGSEEVEAEFARFGETKDGTAIQRNRDGKVHNKIYGAYRKPPGEDVGFNGVGTASRFFYCAKVSGKEKGGSTHPTQKNMKLMDYFVRMITPQGGTILDPFMGSNSTGIAAYKAGFNYIGIERDKQEFEGASRKTFHHLNQTFVPIPINLTSDVVDGKILM